MPPYVVDLLGVQDIIGTCADGLSNQTISVKFELPIEYVDSVIQEYLRFPGWELDLDISPFMVYTSLGGSYDYYKSTIKTVSSLTSKDQINRSFRVCRMYDNIRKEVYKYVK